MTESKIAAVGKARIAALFAARHRCPGLPERPHRFAYEHSK